MHLVSRTTRYPQPNATWVMPEAEVFLPLEVKGTALRPQSPAGAASPAGAKRPGDTPEVIPPVASGMAELQHANSRHERVAVAIICHSQLTICANDHFRTLVAILIAAWDQF